LSTLMNPAGMSLGMFCDPRQQGPVSPANDRRPFRHVPGVALAVVFMSLVSSAAEAQGPARSSPDCAAEAQQRARSGAERNDAAALYLMARYYSTGKCMRRDDSQAIELYWKAANQDYPPAFYSLGILSVRDRDYEAAARLFFRGAQLGDRAAELQLGVLYAQAPRPTGNDESAFAWLSLTASRNEPASLQARKQLAIVGKRMNPASRKRAEALYGGLREQYGSVPKLRP
jgi:TPR repeat protein